MVPPPLMQEPDPTPDLSDAERLWIREQMQQDARRRWLMGVVRRWASGIVVVVAGIGAVGGNIGAIWNTIKQWLVGGGNPP